MVVAFSACEEVADEAGPPPDESAVAAGAVSEMSRSARTELMQRIAGGWSYGDPEVDQLRFDTLGAFTHIDDLHLETRRYIPVEETGGGVRLQLRDIATDDVTGWAWVRVEGDSLVFTFGGRGVAGPTAASLRAGRWALPVEGDSPPDPSTGAGG